MSPIKIVTAITNGMMRKYMKIVMVQVAIPKESLSLIQAIIFMTTMKNLLLRMQIQMAQQIPCSTL